MKNKKKIYDVVFVCSFLVICLLPLKNLTDVSSLDQNFWGRDLLIKTFQSIRLGIGDQVFEKSIRTDDNWLIYTGEISIQDYQNTIPLNENQLETIHTNLQTLDDFLQSKGISLVVVIPPNKNTIYPEHMPDEIPVIGEISRLDQVIDYQNGHNGVEILDLRQSLWNAKKLQQVYYSTDTHWNLYGAYIAYEEIINALHEQFPNLNPYPLANFEFLFQGNSGGDLETTANINIAEKQYQLKFSNLDHVNIEEVIYAYNADKTSKPPVTTFINNDETLPDVFIYHDSFSDNLKYYLPLNFHKTTFLYHLYNDLEFAQIESEDPDVLILEFTERYLAFLLYKLPD